MNIRNIVDQLPKHPDPANTYKTRPLDGVDGISLHHSADEGDPWSWARYQILPQDKGGPRWTPDRDGDGIPDGAPAICYHAAAMRNGRLFKTQNDSTKCWHTADHNHHLIGIVCQGDFTRRPPTEPQVRALLWLVEHYMAAYNIAPENVRGHGEWQGGGTSCPGTWLAAAVRAAISKGDS